MMVVYLGSGKWRPLRRGKNALELPKGDVNFEDPLSLKDRSGYVQFSNDKEKEK